MPYNANATQRYGRCGQKTFLSELYVINTTAFATISSLVPGRRHTYSFPYKSGQAELHGEGYDARIVLP